MGIMMTTFPEALLGVYSLEIFDCPAASRGLVRRHLATRRRTRRSRSMYSTVSASNSSSTAYALQHAFPRRCEQEGPVGRVARHVRRVCILHRLRLHHDAQRKLSKEGFYTNFVMWTGFIVVAMLGWKDSGKSMPNFGNMMRRAASASRSWPRASIYSCSACRSSSSAKGWCRSLVGTTS